MSEEKRDPRIPAGAAIIMIQEQDLHTILGLPDDIHVHHSFSPGAHYGMAIGIMLTTETPGRLPPIALGDATPQIYCRLYHEVRDGKSYYRIEPVLPEVKPS